MPPVLVDSLAERVNVPPWMDRRRNDTAAGYQASMVFLWLMVPGEDLVVKARRLSALRFGLGVVTLLPLSQDRLAIGGGPFEVVIDH